MPLHLIEPKPSPGVPYAWQGLIPEDEWDGCWMVWELKRIIGVKPTDILSDLVQDF